MFINARERQQFKNDPGSFIVKAIRDYVAVSPNNCFPGFPQDRMWDEPLVGFASGDDPLFQEYKKVIGEYHVTPREAIKLHMDASGYISTAEIPHVSVISFILPIAEKTRIGNRAETAVCSVRWSYTRFLGQEFIARLTRYVVALIEGMGHTAVAPELAKWWEMVNSPAGLSSKWSQRHIAYAAGLGTFSLSDGFITPRGIAIRAGSVVCNLDLPATPRPYAGPYANCLFYNSGSCKKCVSRCPAGAIGEKGHDKAKCGAYLIEMRQIAEKLGRTSGYVGKAYLGCGLCQTAVPCEACIPSVGKAGPSDRTAV
jgi:epoxyqueuosine reductase